MPRTMLAVLGWVVTYGPLILAGWLALGLGLCALVSRCGRGLPKPCCTACGVYADDLHELTDHLLAEHPEALPRVDA